MGERYDGPRCYVPRDEYAEVRSRLPFLKPRLRRIYDGGWHYSTRIVREKVKRRDPHTGIRAVEVLEHEVPHRRLHLNQDGPEPFYELADRHHLSHLAKHGPGNIVHLEAPADPIEVAS